MARCAARSTATDLPATRSRRSCRSALRCDHNLKAEAFELPEFHRRLPCVGQRTNLVQPYLSMSHSREGDAPMNKALITAVVMLASVPASAAAQERAGAAALGAVSGAVVLGPIGAVAGAVVGYTAGPAIARSWGVRGSRSARHRQPPRREAYRAAANGGPPRTRESMDANGQMRAASNPPVQAAPAVQPVQAAPVVPAQTTTPPVQGFD
jgi:hypothetical protein